MRGKTFIFGGRSAQAEPAGPTDPQAGAELRAARERLGWPLTDAAAALRIQLSHLRSLEDGDVAALPATAYALGFVRTYSAALGLAPDEMVRRFKAEASEVADRTELAFPAPAPERGLPAGAVVLLGLVLAIGVYIGWYRLSGEGRLPAETVTAVPARLESLAQQAIPPAPSAAPVRPSEPATTNQTARGEPPPHAPALSPSSAAAAPIAPAPAAATIAVPPPAPPLPDQPRLMLRATADAWMLVKDRAGAVLLNRVLKPGETWAAPPKSGLLLTTGNAAGTEVVLDGAAVASLGGTGAVRRDLMLDVDQIKDGKLMPAPAEVAVNRPPQ